MTISRTLSDDTSATISSCGLNNLVCTITDTDLVASIEPLVVVVRIGLPVLATALVGVWLLLFWRHRRNPNGRRRPRAQTPAIILAVTGALMAMSALPMNVQWGQTADLPLGDLVAAIIAWLATLIIGLAAAITILTAPIWIIALSYIAAFAIAAAIHRFIHRVPRDTPPEVQEDS